MKTNRDEDCLEGDNGYLEREQDSLKGEQPSEKHHVGRATERYSKRLGYKEE